MMQPTFVDSSNLNAIGYHNGNLYVRFKYQNQCYIYKGVPVSMYEALKSAESVGKFLNLNIKPHYPYERLTEDPFVGLEAA